MMRHNLAQLDGIIGRRAFLGRIARCAGMAAAYDCFGPRLFGAISADDIVTAQAVYSACGQIVVPVDQDPGWATFEPGISDFGLNVYMGQVLLNNNAAAFDGFRSVLVAMNNAPVAINYGVQFLKMPLEERIAFYTTALTGGFEIDGYGDVLAVGAFLCLLSARGTFFSNYPRHLAQDSEFQVLPPSSVKTGWDIMQFKGPVGPDEEAALRAKNYDATVIPGIDFSNPWI